MSKLLDGIRDAAAARRALNGETPAPAAGEAAAQTGDTASAAVPAEAGVERELERAQNAISAAQTREAIERGAATQAKRKAAVEAAARQLALERIDAEKRAEAAALARVAAEQQATEAAAARAKSERDAEAAALRNAAAQQEAIDAARGREHAAAQAEEAAAACAKAETALQLQIAARVEAERMAAGRERDRLRAEESAAQAAAARAALEARRAAERNVTRAARAPASGFGSRAKAALLQHGALIAGTMAVLLLGIAIGDRAGRNAAPDARVAARAMAEQAEMQLRVDDDIDAFSQRIQARTASPKTAPRKKAPDSRAN